MQWDAPVNIPIVSVNIYEPKQTQKDNRVAERPMASVVRTRCINLPPIYKTSNLVNIPLERTRKSPELLSPLLPSSLPYPTMNRSFTMDCRRILCARPATPIAVFLNMLDFFIGDRQHTPTTAARATTREHRTTPHTTPTDNSYHNAHNTQRNTTSPHSHFRVQTLQSFVFLKMHDELLARDAMISCVSQVPDLSECTQARKLPSLRPARVHMNNAGITVTLFAANKLVAESSGKPLRKLHCRTRERINKRTYFSNTPSSCESTVRHRTSHCRATVEPLSSHCRATVEPLAAGGNAPTELLSHFQTPLKNPYKHRVLRHTGPHRASKWHSKAQSFFTLSPCE